MKIICIGRNYTKHAVELKSQVPEKPVFFLKPDSSLLVNNKPFFYPQFSNEIHHEVEIIVQINRIGKYIEEKFANRYYNKIGVGIDFTARDLQNEHIKKGLPWEIAKAFDNSAPVSKFVPIGKFKNINSINFSLTVNGKIAQQGNTSEMVFPVDTIISYVSRYFTLKMGDIIFTGTPAGVGPVKIGDHLQAFLEEEKMLDFYVK